jgi:hypothetical protein
MSDFHLNTFDPNFFEGGEPPENVKINSVIAQPYEDGRRVRVGFDIVPFQKRPNLEVEITNPGGESLARVDIIEPMTFKFDITMHLRGASTQGKLLLAVRLFYPDTTFEDHHSLTFSV